MFSGVKEAGKKGPKDPRSPLDYAVLQIVRDSGRVWARVGCRSAAGPEKRFCRCFPCCFGFICLSKNSSSGGVQPGCSSRAFGEGPGQA